MFISLCISFCYIYLTNPTTARTSGTLYATWPSRSSGAKSTAAAMFRRLRADILCVINLIIIKITLQLCYPSNDKQQLAHPLQPQYRLYHRLGHLCFVQP